MLAQISSACLTGLSVHDIQVEIDASRGLPSWGIVGLPDTAVRESKERVQTAIKNAGFDLPPRQIVVNLAPAHLKKEGPAFDLAIAVAILAATEQLDIEPLAQYIFIAELGLDGALHRVNGILPMALLAADSGRAMVCSEVNAQESALSGAPTYGFKNLADVVAFLRQPEGKTPLATIDIDRILAEESTGATDFSEIKGQHEAKRAMEIAAAGGHNLLLIGSPGSGKTMLARAMPGIMPPLSKAESLEATKIHSIAGHLSGDHYLVTERPFRAPHHSCSTASLIGGGRIPRPGDVSLAHYGILFMDEFPEYRREVLEALRQPLEDRQVTVSRVQAQVTFPCSFLLIAAMNPCLCGHLNDPSKNCTCTPAQINRYLSKVSGPLLDRFDIQLETTPVTFDDLYDKSTRESSATIRARVVQARAIQLARFADSDVYSNAAMKHRHLKQFCQLDPAGKKLLQQAFQRMGLSARAHDRILKLARTIADLENSETLKSQHIAEAIQYRSLDKKIWQN